MPGGNGTGPAGMGPMTGRGAGYCAGYANAVSGRGFFGFGRGCGRGFGRARGRYGFRAFDQGHFNQVSAPQHELDSLKNQAQHLEDALDGIKNRMAELTDKG